LQRGFERKDEIGKLAQSFNAMVRGLKEAQEGLIHSEKMAALGQLATGIAHEINSPNALIMSGVSTLRKVFEHSRFILDQYAEENGDFLIGGVKYSCMKERIQPLLDGVVEGSDRIRRIAQELRSFSIEGSPSLFDQVRINEVVESAITLTQNMIKDSTRLFSVSFGKHIPSISGNRQQIEQLLINLIQNACQSLAGKEKGLCVSTEYDAGRAEVVVVIADEGVGIPESIMARILDPFFTTKRDSGGSGLGLAVCSRIIHNHKGDLSFRSAPGKGTTVTVTLPVMANRS